MNDFILNELDPDFPGSETGELTPSDLSLLDTLEKLYQGSDKLAIKKLSRNDRGWAWTDRQSNQDGVYLSTDFRGDFFPADEFVQPRADKPHIREMFVPIVWPQLPVEANRPARYVRYTNKGSETHLTRLPKPLFSTAAPASFLVMGRTRPMPELMLQAVLVDSRSVVYPLLEEKFDLRPDFQAGVFSPPEQSLLPEQEFDALQHFIEEAIRAAETGQLPALLNKYAALPDPAALNQQAQRQWLQQNPGKSLNPMVLKNPGDVVRQIISGIQFDLYRQHEICMRSARLIKVLLEKESSPSVRSIVTRLVRNFHHLYSEMLNASQQRKARVGAGFEAHIRTLLEVAAIPFAEQKVVSSFRPDFVLPCVNMYSAGSADALVLSAKTTLRERWKQVTLEKRNCSVYLATMDEKVALASVKKMREHDIHLVVPEAFKAPGTVVDFAQEPNVLTFAEFFRQEIQQRRLPKWNPRC